MNLNPAQQTAYTILRELGNRITHAITQKGAERFLDADYYKTWRDWCDSYITQKLTELYGDHVLQPNSNQYWLWQALSEHDNLCHSLPYYTISLIRLQNNSPTELIILQPESNNYYAAALGNGCQNQASRARVSKARVPYRNMLIAGESLPGKTRVFGSPLLEIAMVADGQLTAGYWPKLGGFLCLAADLLLKESGGIATNNKGETLSSDNKVRKPQSLLIANPRLHKILLDELQRK